VAQFTNSKLLTATNFAAHLATHRPVQNTTFMESVLTKVIDNLQLTIRGLEVRIVKKNSLELGVSLAEVSLFTVDEKGEPAFVERSKKERAPIRKRVALKGGRLFWNSEPSKGKATEKTMLEVNLELKVVEVQTKENSIVTVSAQLAALGIELTEQEFQQIY
jgi:hypothetical protein